MTFNEKLFASFSYLPYNVPKIVRPLFRTMSIVFKIISEIFVSTFVFKILFKHSHCCRFLPFILFASKVFNYQARHKNWFKKSQPRIRRGVGTHLILGWLISKSWPSWLWVSPGGLYDCGSFASLYFEDWPHTSQH